MLTFQLFRLKVFRTPGNLFSEEGTNAELIAEAVQSTPASRRRWRGFVWQIGDLSRIDDAALFFTFGRISRTNVPVFNSASRSFSEAELDTAPFTYIVIDIELGVCGIANRPQLSLKADATAGHLERVLNDTSIAYERFVRFSIEPLKDPEQFIEHLREAEAVVSFALTFSRPNPFDANEDFQKPMERYLGAVKGYAGKTTVKGTDLSRGVLEEMTRSAAATGNDATARLKEPGKPRLTTKRLIGNIVSITTFEANVRDDRPSVIALFRATFQRIRHKQSDL